MKAYLWSDGEPPRRRDEPGGGGSPNAISLWRWAKL
jgi:hypothetical protein